MELAQWPTPNAMEGGQTSRSGKRKKEKLMGGLVSPWPTPRAITGGPESAERKQELGRMESGGGDLQAVAQMANWATPKAEDAESAGHRHNRGVADTLTAQSRLTSWASPQAADGNGSGINQHTHSLCKQTRGQIPTGSPAKTENSGPYRLNPRFSLWLMGLPPEEWASCAVRGMQSLRSKRKRS